LLALITRLQVVLTSSLDSKDCYITTANLDGESTLKVSNPRASPYWEAKLFVGRRFMTRWHDPSAHPPLSQVRYCPKLTQDWSNHELATHNGSQLLISCGPPRPNLYEFDGRINYQGGQGGRVPVLGMALGVACQLVAAALFTV